MHFSLYLVQLFFHSVSFLTVLLKFFHLGFKFNDFDLKFLDNLSLFIDLLLLVLNHDFNSGQFFSFGLVLIFELLLDLVLLFDVLV